MSFYLSSKCGCFNINWNSRVGIVGGASWRQSVTVHTSIWEGMLETYLAFSIPQPGQSFCVESDQVVIAPFRD